MVCRARDRGRSSGIGFAGLAEDGVSGGSRERRGGRGVGKGETNFFIPVRRPVIVVPRTPQDDTAAEGPREDVCCCFVDAGGGALIPMLVVSPTTSKPSNLMGMVGRGLKAPILRFHLVHSLNSHLWLRNQERLPTCGVEVRVLDIRQRERT